MNNLINTCLLALAKADERSASEPTMHSSECRDVIHSEERIPNPAPIDYLPYDLLLKIFLVATSSHPWTVEQTVTLGSVSKRWYTVISSTSLMWPTIDIRFSVLQNKLVLRRNQSGPLSVICTHGHSISRSKSQVKAFLQLAAPHARRWRHFIYTQPFLVEELHSWLSEASSLKSITFFASGGPIPAFPQAMDLRALTTDSITNTNIHQNSLRSIESLRLFRCKPFIPIETLLGILSEATRLRTLDLWAPDLTPDEVHNFDREAEGLVSMDIVELPRLEVFQLCDFPERATNLIATHIRALACKALTITPPLPSTALHPQVFNDLLSSPLRNCTSDLILDYDNRGGLLTIETNIHMSHPYYTPPANHSEPIPEVLVSLPTSVSINVANRSHWDSIVHLLRETRVKSIHLKFQAIFFDTPSDCGLSISDILTATANVRTIEVWGADNAFKVAKLLTPESRSSSPSYPDVKELRLFGLGNFSIEEFQVLFSACIMKRSELGAPLYLIRAPGSACRAIQRVAESRGALLHYDPY